MEGMIHTTNWDAYENVPYKEKTDSTHCAQVAMNWFVFCWNNHPGVVGTLAYCIL